MLAKLLVFLFLLLGIFFVKELLLCIDLRLLCSLLFGEEGAGVESTVADV
jgi:hypothetical protein